MKFALLLTVTSRRSRWPACAAGPDYARQPSPPTAAGPFLGAAPTLRLRRAPPTTIGGGSTTTRCSTGWSRTRSPPTPTSASPSRGSPRPGRSLREERGDRAAAGRIRRAVRHMAACPRPALARRRQRRRRPVDVGLDVAYEVDLFGRVSRSDRGGARRCRRGGRRCRCGARRGRRRHGARLCRCGVLGRAARRWRKQIVDLARPIAAR